MFASFSFYFYFYPSQPFQMGPGKIRETTNQLSLTWRMKCSVFSSLYFTGWLHNIFVFDGVSCLSLVHSFLFESCTQFPVWVLYTVSCLSLIHGLIFNFLYHYSINCWILLISNCFNLLPIPLYYSHTLKTCHITPTVIETLNRKIT